MIRALHRFVVRSMLNAVLWAFAPKLPLTMFGIYGWPTFEEAERIAEGRPHCHWASRIMLRNATGEFQRYNIEIMRREI